jgi:hypothetical protein
MKEFVDIAVFNAYILDKKIICVKMKFNQCGLIMAEQLQKAQQYHHTIKQVGSNDSVQDVPSLHLS